MKVHLDEMEWKGLVKVAVVLRGVEQCGWYRVLRAGPVFSVGMLDSQWACNKEKNENRSLTSYLRNPTVPKFSTPNGGVKFKADLTLASSIV